jgi:hypothetical protein
MHSPHRSARAIKVLGNMEAGGADAVGTGAIPVGVLEAAEGGVESWPNAAEGVAGGGLASAAGVAGTGVVGAWVGGRVWLGSGEAAGRGVSVACWTGPTRLRLPSGSSCRTSL